MFMLNKVSCVIASRVCISHVRPSRTRRRSEP